MQQPLQQWLGLVSHQDEGPVLLANETGLDSPVDLGKEWIVVTRRALLLRGKKQGPVPEVSRRMARTRTRNQVAQDAGRAVSP